MSVEDRAFYFDSGEKDTPEGDYCCECWGMGKIATDYILPRTGAPDECYCTPCKGTGIEPEDIRTILESAVNNGDMVDLKFRTGTSLTCRPTAVGYGCFSVGNNTYWIAEVKSAQVVDGVKSGIYDKLQDALEGQYVVEIDDGAGISKRGRVLEITSKAKDNWRTGFVFRNLDGRSQLYLTRHILSVERVDFEASWDKPEPPDMTLQSRLLWLAINHDKEQGAFIRGLICGATGCTKPEASDITGVWGVSSAELLDQLVALWRKVHVRQEGA